jgi:hypothetical protein
MKYKKLNGVISNITSTIGVHQWPNIVLYIYIVFLHSPLCFYINNDNKTIPISGVYNIHQNIILAYYLL